jgi:hypothetical protein
MRLSGLHILYVEDLSLPLPVLEDEKDGEDKDDKDNKGSKNIGNTKNQNTPAGRAYKDTGLTQKEISRRTGISEPEISKYKSDDPDIARDPSIKSLKRLSKVVNVKQMFPKIL